MQIKVDNKHTEEITMTLNANFAQHSFGKYFFLDCSTFLEVTAVYVCFTLSRVIHYDKKSTIDCI